MYGAKLTIVNKGGSSSNVAAYGDDDADAKILIVNESGQVNITCTANTQDAFNRLMQFAYINEDSNGPYSMYELAEATYTGDSYTSASALNLMWYGVEGQTRTCCLSGDYVIAALKAQNGLNTVEGLVTAVGQQKDTELLEKLRGSYVLMKDGVIDEAQMQNVGAFVQEHCPRLLDKARYAHVLYHPDSCTVYYYDIVGKGWFKKVWQRVKGFCKKVWKAIPKVLGIAQKVATVAAPIIPPPYGTAVAGIASVTGSVSNALNLVGNVSQKTTGLALMDTSGDKFIVTPQYRVSSSSSDYIVPNVPGHEYTPNTVYNGEWISSDPIEVPVNGTSAVKAFNLFRLPDHPNYENIRQYVSTALAAGDTNPLWFQQRLKISFRKTGVPNQ